MARLAAGVRKRDDGTLEKRFTIDGKRYSVYAGTTKEITEKEAELRRQIENNTYVSAKKITLDKYFADFIETKRHTVKPNTVRMYRNMFERYISPAFGNKKVQTIEKAAVKRFLYSLPDDISISTRNYVFLVLQIIMKSAVIDEIIVKSPCDGISALKDEREQTAVESIHRALSEAEQSAFMVAMKNGNEYLYELTAFLLSTGSRFGEATTLRWSDIDTRANCIHIRRTATMNEDNKIIVGNSPKSKAGRRDIPLTEPLKVILKSQKAKQKLLKLQEIDGLVFPAINGGVLKNYVINATIKRIRKQLQSEGINIAPFTAHAFRDTYATRFVEQGGNPQTLKTLLGHTHYNETMDRYAHVLESTKQREAEQINIFVG